MAELLTITKLSVLVHGMDRGNSTLLDAGSEALTSVAGRLVLFAVSIVLGLIAGAMIGRGWPLTWSEIFAPFVWTALASLFCPSYMLVDVITLSLLVAILQTESTRRLFSYCLGLVVAWGWLVWVWS